MAKKRKKAAKKKRAAKRTTNTGKTTAANEEAETEAIEEWLRIRDKPLAIKEGDGRRRRLRRPETKGRRKR
jgi:hypothetical protein